MKPVKKRLLRNTRGDVRGSTYSPTFLVADGIHSHHADVWMTMDPLFRDGLELLKIPQAPSSPRRKNP